MKFLYRIDSRNAKRDINKNIFFVFLREEKQKPFMEVQDVFEIQTKIQKSTF